LPQEKNKNDTQKQKTPTQINPLTKNNNTKVLLLNPSINCIFVILLPEYKTSKRIVRP
jgi:hypothetical protein